MYGPWTIPAFEESFRCAFGEKAIMQCNNKIKRETNLSESQVQQENTTLQGKALVQKILPIKSLEADAFATFLSQRISACRAVRSARCSFFVRHLFESLPPFRVPGAPSTSCGSPYPIYPNLSLNFLNFKPKTPHNPCMLRVHCSTRHSWKCLTEALV